MSKKLIFKIVAALLLTAAAVVWLLSVLLPEKFGFINLSWVIAVAAGILGILFILKGVFEKNVGIAKKAGIFFGAALIVAAILALVGTFIADKYVLPIIAIVISVAVLLSVIAVGGKKWDEGDNKKVGYKNYYQRKAEKEKEEQKEADK
jgi:FtsH-binding integral membrane protein